MIKKIGKKYAVLSEKTVRRGSRQVRRSFGSYATKTEAEKKIEAD